MATTSAASELPLQAPQSTHAYLGELQDVEHVARSYFPVGAVVKLPLVVLPDIVLFPGDELPLRMLSNMSIEAIRDQLRGDGAVLAVLCAYQEGDVAYGTTVRIEKFSLADSGGSTAAVTGAAKQRFRVRSDVQTQLADVEILPHPSPLRVPFCVPRTLAQAPKRRIQHQPFVGYWGRREFALFDVHALVTRIQRMFARSAQWSWFCAATSGEPQQPTQSDPAAQLAFLQQPSEQMDASAFAYWVAGNLPLARTERLALLRIDCVAQLLRAELALLGRCGDVIACARCSARVASISDIVRVLPRDAGGTFVNPGGFVFQVLTLRAVMRGRVAVELVRSTQDSWFPGYAWSIAYCRVCEQHLGWQFDAVDALPTDDDSSSSGSTPTRFFGFRRGALTQSTHVDSNRNDDATSAAMVQWIAQGVDSSDWDSDVSHSDSDDDDDDADDDDTLATNDDSDALDLN